VPDLRGRTIAVLADQVDAPDFPFLAVLLRSIDIEIDEVALRKGSLEEGKLRLASGEVDAFITFPPHTQELREKGVGHVLLSSIEDPPWSQNYCCVLMANSDFIKKYPTATRRVLRAYLLAADDCRDRPEDVADFMVQTGQIENSDYSSEMMRVLPYDVWRTHQPEDSFRFYGNLMYDTGLLRRTPREIINRGTDWRFLESLRPELAARPRFAPARARAVDWHCDLTVPKAASVGQAKLQPGGQDVQT
jgi:NitT/TauT family transport system substrate-binding protein